MLAQCNAGRGNDFRELSVSSNVVRVSRLFNKVGGDGVEFLAYVEGGRQSPLLIGIEHDERIGAEPGDSFDEALRLSNRRQEPHEEVWPEVLDTIRHCNIRNYSIYLKHDLLFGYFEYHGSDFEADMAKMAADPKTQEWWKLVGPMQLPLESRAKGEWWASMEEVFHFD